MTGQIRMTPDQMRGRANEYRQQAEQVETVIGKMDNLLSALQGEWEGAASQAYAARFGELRPSFVNARELIEEIARSLDAAATTLEQADQAIASGM